MVKEKNIGNTQLPKYRNLVKCDDGPIWFTFSSGPAFWYSLSETNLPIAIPRVSLNSCKPYSLEPSIPANNSKGKRKCFGNLFCCFGSKETKQHTKQEQPIPDLLQNQFKQHEKSIIEKPLLPPVHPNDIDKKCLVVDLDETLVHSSFLPVKNADLVIPIEMDNMIHPVYVMKRPHVDEFLHRIGKLYECVLFTASASTYADPVTDRLDKCGVFRTRLFREACVIHKGNYIKDLGRLGRDLKEVVIIDNSPSSYSFHPGNAIPIKSWFDDAGDRELMNLIPLLEKLAKVENVYTILANDHGTQTAQRKNRN